MAAPVSLRTLLLELSAHAPNLTGDGEVRITDLEQDSRRITPGQLFVARAGAAADGARFVPMALERGAAAILTDHDAELPPVDVPVLRVAGVARALSLAAEVVHGFPSRDLRVVGVTGTNGKTTSVGLLVQVLTAAGVPTARLGTLGYAFGDDVEEGALTTPGAEAVSRYLARARDRGAAVVAMEVSSHALDQRRVDGVRFDVAALSNLTQDHLDYHGTMEAYGAAKARLFLELAPRVAVLNVDDPFGRSLAGRVVGASISVGRSEHAAVQAGPFTMDRGGMRGAVQTPRGVLSVASPLVGEHNLDNLLLVVGICHALGVEAGAMAHAIGEAQGVPGRLERCDGEDDDILVLVDYAHTPDALDRALAAVKPLADDRPLICAFGCGGDRDAGKRPLMGAAAARHATRVIVTSDNPRTEDPRRIIDDILPGVRTVCLPYLVEPERRRAIREAIVYAAPGAVVLIAGKGHETYQIVGESRFDFDDRVEARKALAERRSRRSENGAG